MQEFDFNQSKSISESIAELINSTLEEEPREVFLAQRPASILYVPKNSTLGGDHFYLTESPEGLRAALIADFPGDKQGRERVEKFKGSIDKLLELMANRKNQDFSKELFDLKKNFLKQKLN